MSASSHIANDDYTRYLSVYPAIFAAVFPGTPSLIINKRDIADPTALRLHDVCVPCGSDWTGSDDDIRGALERLAKALDPTRAQHSIWIDYSAQIDRDGECTIFGKVMVDDKRAARIEPITVLAGSPLLDGSEIRIADLFSVEEEDALDEYLPEPWSVFLLAGLIDGDDTVDLPQPIEDDDDAEDQDVEDEEAADIEDDNTAW